MHATHYISKLLLLGIICLSSISCKKFLQAYSQYDSFINTAADAEELLVADGYFDYRLSSSNSVLFEMDDDVSMGIPQNTAPVSVLNGYYNWQTNPRINAEGRIDTKDESYSNWYTRIGRLNTILESIQTLRERGQSEAALNKVAGEAHFLRAYYYHFLVNIFGKPYKASTADQDYGVPLKTEAAINSQFVSRATTKQVYDQMVADLLLANQLLEGSNEGSKKRANRAAVHALLSKVYLYMENYEESLRYADLVLENKSYSMVDLNAASTNSDYQSIHSPEVIFTMGTNNLFNFFGLDSDVPNHRYFIPSDELRALFETNDLRKQLYFVNNSNGVTKFAKIRTYNQSNVESVSNIFLLRLAEVHLNKAEALAAQGEDEAARVAIQAFRKTRFKPSELPDVTESGIGLVNFIRNERRKELFMEGHRWFDLRRYGVSAQFPFTKTSRHRNIVFTGTTYAEDGYYELGAYDVEPASYVIPIASGEIEFNQGLLKNEDRPERPLKH